MRNKIVLKFQITTPGNNTNILLMNIGYQSLSADIVPLVLDRLRLIAPDFAVFLITAVTTVLAFNSPTAPPEEGL